MSINWKHPYGSVPVDEGSGLGYNESGKLTITPDRMSIEVIGKIKDILGVERDLLQNTTFLCDPVLGDDATGDGLAFPFKTPQFAVNYISRKFNFGHYNATLSVLAGDCGPLVLPKYLAGTGIFTVKGVGAATRFLGRNVPQVVSGRVSAGVYNLQKCSVEGIYSADGPTDAYPNVMGNAVGFNLYLKDVDVIITEESAAPMAVAGINASGATLSLLGNCSVKTNALASGTRINSMLSISAGGNMYYNGALTLNGICGNTVFAQAKGLFTRGPAAVAPAGSVTGRRYLAQGNAGIETGGGGPNYFPGSAAGTVDATSYYT